MALHSKYKGLNYSQTVIVGEHTVMIPPLPTDPKDVFFIDDTADKAFWNRDRILKKDYRDIFFKFIPNETLLTPENKSHIYITEFDDEGFAISLNEEDSDYIRFCYEREFDRRTNGVHFRNGNDIEWVTGDHWFVLMWCKTKRPDKKGDYFDFREFQQKDFFYLIFHSLYSLIIRGCFWSKAKKTGITNLMWLYYLNKATMTKNINLGNMNIDQDKGATTHRDHFLYALDGLPLILMPETKTRQEKDGVTTFGKRYTGKKSTRNNEAELNTTVRCVASAMNAFDVDVFTDVWYDEAPKLKSDFGVIYRSNSGATMIQDFIVGKQWITSYTPEKSGDSFKSAKDLFYDSELTTIKDDSEGKTKSLLICHHIPAFKSWGSSFNKYGKCDEKDAKSKITKELELLFDRPQEYLKKRREYANTKKDAWSVGDASSIYDPIRLAELEFDLELLQRATKTFEQGELQWENPMWEVGKKDKRPKGVFGNVKWVPLSQEKITKGSIGKIRQYEPIPKEEQNKCLQYGMDEHSNLLPPPRFAYCGGVDPADFRDAGNFEEGSMVGIYTMAVHDTLRNTLAQRVVTRIDYLEYLARPDNPEEWYQDIVKQIIYTGMLVIVEANNGTIATRLEDEGLGHYMLFKNSAGVIQQYVANHKNNINSLYPLKHIKNTKSGNVDTVSDMIVHFKSYLLPGNPEYGEIDYGRLIRSERLLKQLKEFDPANTKPFDLHMAKGYALMAHDNYIALQSVVQDDRYKPNEINAVVSALEKYF